MRTTLAEVARGRGRITDWWLDTPWKRPRNWWTMLFEPGRGWLRWGWGEYDYITEVVIPETGQGPRAYCPCAPPLRRAAAAIRDWLVSYPRSWAAKARGERDWVDPCHMRCGDWSWARDPDWPHGYLLH